MYKYLLAALVVCAAVVAVASGWWVKGHESVTEAAAAGLPDDVPAFFRTAGKTIAHFAGDPDRWKNRDATFLRAAESPNHYLDLEDLEGKDLPADRHEAFRLVTSLKHKPEQTGTLPYALMENYDRLSCAFKDYRDDPKNPAVQMKCQVYAGILAHYTGDTVMPLHTTRDYDGKRRDGKVLQKGIHAKIDAFPEKNGFTAEEICRGLKAKQIDDVWKYVMQTIKESHQHVERCYELDAAGVFDKPTPESRRFIMERCRAGAQFTMDLWYTAWLRSAKMPAHY